eukprot:gene26159-34210_t
MSALRTDASNMVICSLVADAATMGLHWIYNAQDILEKVSSGPTGKAAFFQPPSCPFYQYETGRLSPYGDEIIPFLRSFTLDKGIVKSSAASVSYEFFRTYTGRLNHVTKAFVENRDAGKPWEECPIVDHQAQGIIKMPLTVARYAGHPDLFDRVTDVVEVIHRSDPSLEASRLLAVILERILLTGATPEEAIQWAAGSGGQRVFTPAMTEMISLVANDALIHELTDFYAKLAAAPLMASILRTKNLSSSLDSLDEGDKGYLASLSLPLSEEGKKSYTLSETVAALGLSCAVPGCLLSSLVIARRTSSLEEAVEANILAGGDNCSRAIVVGALWSRSAGTGDGAGVLAKWNRCVKEDVLQEIISSAQDIVASNQYL